MNKNYFIDLYSSYIKEKALVNKLYLFDKKLKLLLLNSLFDIEQKFQTVYTANFIRRYDDTKESIIDVKNYSNDIMTPIIIEKVKKQLDKYKISLKEEQFYIKKYNYIPIGAYIKILSFGLLRDLYYISKPNDKDHICRELAGKDISSKNLETILEFLAKIRNICCHNEILFSYVSEDIMIPTTIYHNIFKQRNKMCGKKDFLATLICIKLLSNNEEFAVLIKEIDQLIDEYSKELHISKNQLLRLMHLPIDYTKLKLPIKEQ